MPSTTLCSVIFLACAVTLSAAQRSCKGQCGGEYYRGYDCQCDYTCMGYGECCKDFESQCTTATSCQGRCGEPFKRGRKCSCDPDCAKYNQCCSDFKAHCDEEEENNGAESVSAPCNSVKDNKPKDPPQYEATEDPFIEGNNEDYDTFPEPTPSSQDDPSDDTTSQTSPDEELSDNGPEDPADQLDQVTTEATLLTDAPISSDIEPTQADADSPTESADVSDPEVPTTSPNSGTTLPPTSTSVEQVPSQPASTSAPETEPEPTDNTPEVLETDVQPDSTSAPETEPEPTDNTPEQLETDVQPDSTSAPETEPEPTDNTPETDEQAQDTDPDPAEVPTTTSSPPVTPESTELTKDCSTASEDCPDATTPASTTLEPTPIPDATTSNKEPEVTENNSKDATTGPSSSLPDPQDPSTSASPVAEVDSKTTDAPTLTDAVKDDTSDDVQPQKVTPEATSKPQDKPEPSKPKPTKPTPAKPTPKQPETKPVDTVNIDNPRDYQGDDSNDTNLCSGRPVGAVTTLKNGTVVVFRGHYFWFLDRNKVPGPARGITQVWGVPSPIDTSFTRCNCQGKTYIFKGPQYWRYENDVLDPGYPKAIQSGFDGLRGQVTAALSVPQYRNRREAVYFFKRGGTVQKYSYQFGTSPTCGKKVQYTVPVHIHTVRNRLVRQAVSLLGPTITIRKTWKGFPSTITAAASVPTTREPEGYKYYVFSRTKSYNIRISGERPVVAPPKVNAPPHSNEVFKCPKKV